MNKSFFKKKHFYIFLVGLHIWYNLFGGQFGNSVNMLNAWTQCCALLSVWRIWVVFVSVSWEGDSKPSGALGSLTPAQLPDLWSRYRAGDWVQSHGRWFNQLYLHNETPMTALDAWGSMSFLAGEHVGVLEGWCVLKPQGEDTKTPHSSPCQTSSIDFFICLVLIWILHNKTIMISAVLS